LACLTVQAASGIRSITINLTTIAGTIMDRFLDHMATPPITGRTRLRCRHKAKVELGPTGSFGRDALRRILHVADDQYVVSQTLVANSAQTARRLQALNAGAPEARFITAGQEWRDKAPDLINQILIAQLP